MKNIDMQIEGDILILKIDLSKDFGDSRSGKTIMVATTEGNQTVPGHDDMKMGVNLFRYKDLGKKE